MTIPQLQAGLKSVILTGAMAVATTLNSTSSVRNSESENIRSAIHVYDLIPRKKKLDTTECKNEEEYTAFGIEDIEQVEYSTSIQSFVDANDSYFAGYLSFRATQEIGEKCENCLQSLMKCDVDVPCRYQELREYKDGALKRPPKILFIFAKRSFQLFESLLSRHLETCFVHVIE